MMFRTVYILVAIGADSPGKQELDPHIIGRSELVITDDHQQCLDHGEFGVAHRNHLIDVRADVSMGSLLLDSTRNTISGNGISVVDLTGLGGQDLAIASLVWNKIKLP